MTWSFASALIQYHIHTTTKHRGANRLTHPYKYILIDQINNLLPYSISEYHIEIRKNK